MIVGRLTKDSANVTRVTVDFSDWLDDGEVVSGTTVPVVALEQTTTCIGTAPPTPTDTTPLVVDSTTVVSAGLAVQLMLAIGTPGLTYKVTFVATGGTSARETQVDVIVAVRTPA